MAINLMYELDRLTGGNKLGKVLVMVSFAFLVLSIFTILTESQTIDPASGVAVTSERPWKLAGIFFLLSIVSSYIAYRLVGGRSNPELWTKDSNDFKNDHIPEKLSIGVKISVLFCWYLGRCGVPVFYFFLAESQRAIFRQGLFF